MRRALRLISLAVLLVTLVACGESSGTTAPPSPLPRGPLPTIAAVSWRKASVEINADNGARLELLGTLTEHTATVSRIAFTPDSRYMVTLDAVLKPVVWDMETGRALHSLTGDNAYRYVFFNARGDQVIGVLGDQQIFFFATPGGGALASVAANSTGITIAAQSDDRTLLATGGKRGDVQIWDVDKRTIQRTLTLSTQPILLIAFTPDNQSVAAVSSDSTLTVASVADGKQKVQIKGFNDVPRRLLYTSDGRLLVAAVQNRVFVYNADDYSFRYSITADEMVTETGLAISPDNRYIAVNTTTDSAVVFALEDGRQIVGVPAQEKRGSSLAFAPNGSLLLATVLKPQTGAFIWSVASFSDDDPRVLGRSINPQGNGVFVGAWSPDSRMIVLADGSGGLFVWGLPATG